MVEDWAETQKASPDSAPANVLRFLFNLPEIEARGYEWGCRIPCGDVRSSCE